MLDNIKIGVKLTVGFLMVAFIAAVIGTIGVAFMQKIKTTGNKIYTSSVIPLTDMITVYANFEKIRIAMRNALLSKDASGAGKALEKMDELAQMNSELVEKYGTTLNDKDDQKLYENLMGSRKEYHKYLEEFKNEINQNRAGEALAMLSSPDYNNAVKAEEGAIENIVKNNIDDAKNYSQANDATARTTTIILVIIIAIGVFLALGAGLVLARAFPNRFQRPLIWCLNWEKETLWRV